MSTFKPILPPDPLLFSTYDLEWDKEQNVTLVGVYDERKGFRYYRTVKEFIVSELTSENYGVTFFAHAGGKYDFQFLFNCMVEENWLENRYDVEIAFNGSSAFLVDIYHKRIFKKEQKWRFADSVFLFQAKIAEIGKLIGMEKGEVDFETQNFQELVDYNEQDCRILYEGIKQLDNRLRLMGGGLKVTLASSAMRLFQCKYLRREIETSFSINEISREAYYASRVEVFQKYCENADYWDICSSFPHSMTKALPANCTKVQKEIPKNGLYMARVKVEVPEMYLPPVPIRDKHKRIMFPTGKWECYLTKVDIELAEKYGCKVKNLKEVYLFDEFYDLKDYVIDLYEKKAKAKGFERLLYKLLLNSLYGKFAESNEKEKMILYPESIECQHVYRGKKKHKNDSCMRMFSNKQEGAYIRTDFLHSSHIHVPISAFVTAYSRELLYEYLIKSKKFYYCDTDSVVCHKNNPFKDSDILGELKYEYDVIKGELIAPKLYRLMVREKGEEKQVLRTKGFPRLTSEGFDKILNGESVVLKRWISLKENYRSGDTRPKEREMEKRVYLDTQKRKFLENGDSRPLDIKELDL